MLARNRGFRHRPIDQRFACDPPTREHAPPPSITELSRVATRQRDLRVSGAANERRQFCEHENVPRVHIGFTTDVKTER